MADADEDLIVRATPNVHEDNEDHELSDELQDFRFVAALTSSGKQSLPRRGEKDFETHGTQAQEDILQESRDAMLAALSFERTHKPDAITGSLIIHRSDSGPVRIDCIIERPKGNILQTLGRNSSGGRCHLLPEECLYLVERGSLHLVFASAPGAEAIPHAGLSVDLQTAYTYLIGYDGLTLERYQVYAGLKRSGYNVLRSACWHATPDLPPSTPVTRMPCSRRLLGNSAARNPTSSLVRPGLYHSYTPIYEKLATAINVVGPTAFLGAQVRPDESAHHPNLRPAYNVHKPGTTSFKKSSPPPPDFQICVLDARTEFFPSLQSLEMLFMAVAPYTAVKSNVEATRCGKSVTIDTVYEWIHYLLGITARTAPSITHPKPANSRAKAKKPFKSKAANSTTERSFAPAVPDQPGQDPALVCQTETVGRKPGSSERTGQQASERLSGQKQKPKSKPGHMTKLYDWFVSWTTAAAGTPLGVAKGSRGRNGGAGKMYQRLRQGHQSTILAVVDQGVVSYVRFADAWFGGEKVWQEVKNDTRRGKNSGRQQR